jgi:predicted dehydrogenase
MNEFELYRAEGRGSEQGYAKILAAPAHHPYDRFIPAPGHGLGFNDLKIIECRELIRAISGEPSSTVAFSDGLRIEKSVHAMAQSFHERRWIEIAD